MGRPSTQNAYSQSAGLAGILAPVQEGRDPTSLDVNYPLYREWVNTSTRGLWILMSFTSTSGTVLANWVSLTASTNGAVDSLTGNDLVEVQPDTNGNVNVVGGNSINVTGNNGTHTLTASVSGTTNHAVQVGTASGALSSIGIGTSNTALLGNTGADPSFGQVPNAALQHSTITMTAGSGINIIGSPVALGGDVTISSTALSTLTFTEDLGSATVSADNINILGSSIQGIVTTGGGSTVTIDALNATSTQKGVASFNATDFTVTAGAVTSNAFTVSAGTGLTGGGSLNLGGSTTLSLGIPVTVPHGGTGLTSTPTNGQLLIGNTGSAGYNLANLTSTGGTVAITNGAGSINLEVGGTTFDTLTGNSGGAVSPTAGNINVVGDGTTITITGNPGTSTLTASLIGGLAAIEKFIPDTGTSPVVPNGSGQVTMSGSGSIQTVGGTNQLTTQLTGLTNHAVLVGAGTTTITKVGPSSTTGAPLISAGASSDPTFSTTFTITDSTGVTSLSKSNSGATNQISNSNTSNTASSAAANIVSVAGTSAGDAYSQWSVGSTMSYALGTDTPTTRQPLKLNYAVASNVTPSTGTNLLTIDTAGSGASTPSFTYTGGLLRLIENGATDVVEINVRNTNSADFSVVSAESASPKTGFFTSGQYDTPLFWNFGMASTLSNAFVINTASAHQAPEGGTRRWRLSQTGAVTFNEAFTFPTTDGSAGQVLTTDGAGTVTWSSSGVGTWIDNSGTFTAGRNTAYFLTAASTVTLPASPSQGDTVDFVCDTTGSCVITGNTGQSIRISNQISSVAGTATNSARGDTLSLVYRAATTTWFADVAPNGGWTTA